MKSCKLNLAGIPKELKALLNIIAENDIYSIGSDYNDFDWSLFLKLIKHHRIFPGLYLKIHRLGDGRVPTEVLKKLEAWHQTNTFKMLHLTGEMVKVNELLNKNKIRSLFLKGPILAKALYGELSLRTSSDLDLLVRIKDLKFVEELLLQQGYVKDDYIETVLNDWKWRHHHITFFHPQNKVKLEVHWRLNPGPSKEPSFEELWHRRQRLTVTISPIHFLGFEDLFFFLVTHGARHGWSRLRWLLDIHQLLDLQLDWIKIQKLFKKYNELAVAGQALLLSNKLFSSEIEEALKILKVNEQKSRRLAQDCLFYFRQMINLHNEPLPDEVSRYHKNYLIGLIPPKHKVLFYLSFLFPYPEDAKTLPLPKKLHFTYFFLRPFILMWRRKKRSLSQEVKG